MFFQLSVSPSEEMRDRISWVHSLQLCPLIVLAAQNSFVLMSRVADESGVTTRWLNVPFLLLYMTKWLNLVKELISTFN